MHKAWTVFQPLGRDSSDYKLGWLNLFARRGPVDTMSSLEEGRRDEPSDQAERNSTGGNDFTFKNQIQRTIFRSPVNLLLLAAPAGIALWAFAIPGPAVFVVNFVAIIPLAALLSEATEQVVMRTGESIGALINATFG
ncbi:hypothetical protein F5Y16DRAFT_406189 [Xylariaceae sp. FL0255]|nr:hypothetical protein F5Y16DRAFT_406189 [Xylariaceae sp. FL0255]